MGKSPGLEAVKEFFLVDPVDLCWTVAGVLLHWTDSRLRLHQESTKEAQA